VVTGEYVNGIELESNSGERRKEQPEQPRVLGDERELRSAANSPPSFQISSLVSASSALTFIALDILVSRPRISWKNSQSGAVPLTAADAHGGFFG